MKSLRGERNWNWYGKFGREYQKASLVASIRRRVLSRVSKGQFCRKYQKASLVTSIKRLVWSQVSKGWETLHLNYVSNLKSLITLIHLHINLHQHVTYKVMLDLASLVIYFEFHIFLPHFLHYTLYGANVKMECITIWKFL